jgi:hypothetical protein
MESGLRVNGVSIDDIRREFVDIFGTVDDVEFVAGQAAENESMSFHWFVEFEAGS